MGDSTFQNSGCVNTILGSLNQLSAFLPLVYRTDMTTTLNRKYSVLADVQPTSTPKLMYFGVGLNGYICAGGTNLPMHNKRLPDGRNMDLYAPIPIRMRRWGEDLSFEERKMYRMRAIREIDGEKYICYYLKVIDWDTNNVDIIRCNSDGSEDNYAFENRFLNPSPTDQQVTGGALTSADRIVVRALGRCGVNMSELSEAMNIIYGLDYCTISEFGFYTGYDVYVNDDEVLVANVDVSQMDDDDTDTDHTDYSQFNMEAAYVQLAKHKTQLPIALDSANSELVTQVSFEASNSISI